MQELFHTRNIYKDMDGDFSFFVTFHVLECRLFSSQRPPTISVKQWGEGLFVAVLRSPSTQCNSWYIIAYGGSQHILEQSTSPQC